LTLVPGGHGVFDVTVNGTLVFSKLKDKRFPEVSELAQSIRKYLD
jgi:selT/selW/selH-like putative selenoprotein